MHLVTATTITWQQAWTMPVGMARWSSVEALKLAGARVDIWTPEHQARFEVHKRKREAKIDARGKEIARAESIPYETARQKAHDEYWAQIENQRALATAKSKHRSR